MKALVPTRYKCMLPPLAVAFIPSTAGDSGCTLSFLPLDVPVVDSELLDLVRSAWPPDPLINTVTSPVRVDQHPVTMVGNFFLSRDLKKN